MNTQPVNEALTSLSVRRANEERAADEKSLFGFWVYLMTDCVLFASLFAVYAVLHNNTNGGAPAAVLFNLHSALAETLILLSSSFACGMAMLAVQQKKKRLVLFALAVTALLGLCFLGIEINEFYHLYVSGNSWRRSGFLSSFFVLVGTHGLHITIGLIWMGVMAIKLTRKGLTRNVVRRLNMLSLFWHFLDVIWIFIFTIVYLMGAVRV